MFRSESMFCFCANIIISQLTVVRDISFSLAAQLCMLHLTVMSFIMVIMCAELLNLLSFNYFSLCASQIVIRGP